jgi:hypothetical protein
MGADSPSVTDLEGPEVGFLADLHSIGKGAKKRRRIGLPLTFPRSDETLDFRRRTELPGAVRSADGVDRQDV